MNTDGHDAREPAPRMAGGATPDVTARVMQRLGYVQADAARARALRRQHAYVRVLQGVIVLSAVALGAVWWFGGTVPAQRAPEVVATLRGSIARGAGDIDGFLAGLPRMPQTSMVHAQGGDADESQPPAATLEHAPQLRSY